MNGFDNTNIKDKLCGGCNCTGFAPLLSFVYDPVAKTIVFTDTTTYPSADDRKVIQLEIRDKNAKRLPGFIASRGSGAAATSAVASNAVTGVTVTAGGTLYGTAPRVVFGGPGTGAAGTAVLTNGVVTSVTITAGGTGYTSAPTVTFVNVDASTIDVSTADPSEGLTALATIVTKGGCISDGHFTAVGVNAVAGTLGSWDKDYNAITL